MRRRLALAVLGATAVMAVAAAATGIAVMRADPLKQAGEIAVSKLVVDRDGSLLRAFQTEDDRWRLPVSADRVDPTFLTMLKAYEDKRFDDHHGVDPWAMLRAVSQAVLNGGIVSGGSTLTMQAARLLKEHPTRSLSSKFGQIADALALERDLSKDEILELYLLRAPYGGNIEGIRAATLAWFGKEPARLTPAEAALLVALPQAPEARRPDRHPENARLARDRVLERMAKAGVLSPDDAQAAKRDPVPTARRDVPILAAHAARQAIDESPNENVIALTLLSSLQSSLEKLAAERAAALGKKVSAAILVADHQSGEILAHVGSAGLLDDPRRGHVDMTGAIRSPGSTLKPLIYGLAFEDGLAHPESLVDDTPATISGYSPTNFDKSFQGTVSIREALQLSLNVPAIKLLDAVGAPKFAGRLRMAGVKPRLSDHAATGLAVGLGGLGVSLRDLVALYAGLARGGDSVALFERKGEGARLPDARRFLDSVAAWYVGDILLGTPAPPHAASDGIAYKTGTSYGYRDAWAIGFDGRHVIGVWIGRADGTPVPGISGFETAAPILFEAFQRLGGRPAPLMRRPEGALAASVESLPVPLRNARVAGAASPASGRAGQKQVEIAFPPDGAMLELSASDRQAPLRPLVVKLRKGTPPFSWFANGRPVASGYFERSLTWQPDSPGLSVISVVDSKGASDRVTLDLR